MERQFYLYTDNDGVRSIGGFDDVSRPADAEALQCVYGDTDSVFVLMPGLSVEEAGKYSARISKWFQANILKAPHDLEFEKVRFQRTTHSNRSNAAYPTDLLPPTFVPQKRKYAYSAMFCSFVLTTARFGCVARCTRE